MGSFCSLSRARMGLEGTSSFSDNPVSPKIRFNFKIIPAETFEDGSRSESKISLFPREVVSCSKERYYRKASYFRPFSIESIHHYPEIQNDYHGAPEINHSSIGMDDIYRSQRRFLACPDKRAFSKIFRIQSRRPKILFYSNVLRPVYSTKDFHENFGRVDSRIEPSRNKFSSIPGRHINMEHFQGRMSQGYSEDFGFPHPEGVSNKFLKKQIDSSTNFRTSGTSLEYSEGNYPHPFKAQEECDLTSSKHFNSRLGFQKGTPANNRKGQLCFLSGPSFGVHRKELGCTFATSPIKDFKAVTLASSAKTVETFTHTLANVSKNIGTSS